MLSELNTRYVSLDQVSSLARGNKEVILEYLHQFIELVSDRLSELSADLSREDREGVRESLHRMIPQLEVFGLGGVVGDIRNLAYNYQDMPWEELESIAEGISSELDMACDEVAGVIHSIS
jgi:HPt (histidine-containing phosphotransfer) domain-containing protein